MNFCIVTLVATVLTTTTFGAWKPLGAPTTGIDYQGIAFTNTYTGCAVGTSGTIIKTTNGGKSWKIIPSGVTANLRAIHFATALKGWIAGHSGTILVTSDGGESWQKQTSPVTFDLTGIGFLNESIGYAVSGTYTTGATTVKTTNGGASWAPVGTAGIYASNDVDVLSPTAAVMATYSGVWKTTDGGGTWLQKTTGARVYSIDFVNATTGLAVGSEGLIYSTFDAGDSWKLLAGTSYSTYVFYGVSYADENYVWAAATGIIIASTNGGVTWQTEPGTGAIGYLYGISAVNRGRAWACGQGGILKVYTNPDYKISAPDKISFDTYSSTIDTSFVIANTGLDSVHIMLTLEDSAFSIISPKKFIIKAGETKPVTIRFTPLQQGMRSAVVLVESEDSTSPARVTLEGNYVVGVDDQAAANNVFGVLKHYPDPASDRVTIEWLSVISRQSSVLEVCDVLGRVVTRQLVSSERVRVDLDVSRFAAGIYHYTLRNGLRSMTGKMVVR